METIVSAMAKQEGVTVALKATNILLLRLDKLVFSLLYGKLLNTLDCANDAGISDVKKQIAIMERALKNLEEQESKYATELEDALKQYADLKTQAADMDAVELMDARLNIRPDRERSVREFLCWKQQQQAQQKTNKKKSRDRWER